MAIERTLLLEDTSEFSKLESNNSKVLVVIPGMFMKCNATIAMKTLSVKVAYLLAAPSEGEQASDTQLFTLAK